ncbi:hypothetical protein TcYC6_0095630 [Trypanosoma cruzi]|nr:hypothetical protein TcYC6_0095630 [Trypanosoma cruzi]
MAGGVPSSAVRHSSAAYRRPHGNVGRPHFHPSTPLPSRTSPLEAQSPMEEDRGFCAFDVTTWPTRIWNEGASGVVCDLRCAYQCWQQEDEEKVNLAFDNLFEWIGVLEGGQDRTDRFMNLRRPLMNTFRMQLTIASDPGIRLSKLRARLYTAVHQTGTYAKAAPSNPPPPTNPHRQRTAPPTLHPIFQIARRNRREGKRAYLPTTLDCGTTNRRQPCFGPVV